MNETTSNNRRLLGGDLLLVAVVLVGGVLFMQPGIFSVDESHYLLATQAVVKQGSFHIENGYEQQKDPALLYFYTVVPERVDEMGTQATVPPYHAVLAAPFLLLGGVRGLIWLNLLALAATLLGLRRLAGLLGLGRRASWLCALGFFAGGMSLEYALGLWPHALSQALACWSVVLVFRADAREKGGAGLWLAAGMLAGVATGVRLQNIVWLPVLGGLALAGRQKWRNLSAWLGGWLPPLLGMVLINLRRLGTGNPFTYGAASPITGLPVVKLLAGYWPALAGVLAVFSLLLICAYRYRGRLARRHYLGMALTGLLVVVIVPATRWLLVEMTRRWLFFLLDPALGPASLGSAGGHPGAWGQIYYGGVLKKGLLEVFPPAGAALLLPWLVGTRRLPAWRLWSVTLAALLLLPGIVSAGGWCYNPRYLLELLPLLFVGAMAVLRALPPARPFLLGGLLVGLLAALPVMLQPGGVADPAPGLYQLAAGTVLGGGLLLALLLHRTRRLAAPAGRIAAGLLAAAFGYGLCVQLGGDLPASLRVRHYAGEMATAAEQVIPEKALLFAWEARKDVFTPLKLNHDVWIGGLRWRDQRLPPSLARLPAERRVFILRNGIPPGRWRQIVAGRRLRARRVRDLAFVELLGAENR